MAMLESDAWGRLCWENRDLERSFWKEVFSLYYIHIYMIISLLKIVL